MSTALLTVQAVSDVLSSLPAHLPAAMPDPGAGSAPAGADSFNTLLGNLKWLCLGVCIAALFVAGARIAWGHRHSGDGAESLGWIGSVALGVFVISAAVGLVSAFSSTTSKAPAGGGAGAAPATSHVTTLTSV